MFLERTGNHEDRWVPLPREQLEVGSRVLPRGVECDDDHVWSNALDLDPCSLEGVDHAKAYGPSAEESRTRNPAVQLDEHDLRRAGIRGFHERQSPSNISGTAEAASLPDSRETLRQVDEAPQGVPTCFELDTHFPGESLRIHRAQHLPGVEFWSVVGSERKRTLVSDMFSACVVLPTSPTSPTSPSSPTSRDVQAKVWVRGEEKLLASGAVVLAEPGELLHVTPVGGKLTLFIIRWSALSLRAFSAHLAFELHFHVPDFGAGRLSVTLQHTFRLLAEGAPVSALDESYRQVSEEVLAVSADPAASRRPPPGHPRIRPMLARLNEGSAESVALDELAAEAKLSKFHFVRCFRKTAGLAPHQYLKLLRLQQARRSLEDGLSVSATARRFGFADAPHFVRSFRTSLGVAPGVWAKAWRASDPSAERMRTEPPPSHGARARSSRRVARG
jgi:AraC-like DNA-binding protein